MINVQIAQSLISLISFVIAYIISVTIAGCFTSWVALKMGDETPADSGFITLNPLMHLDIMGFLFMILFRFGWGRFIPINPHNITGKFRVLKRLVAFLAEPFCYLVISTISLVSVIALMGKEVLFASAGFFDAFPGVSSYSFAISLIVMSMIFVNVMLAMITFLVNMCGLGVIFFMEKYPDYMMYTSLIMVGVPMLIVYFFRNQLINFGLAIVQFGGLLICYWLGLL